jgi:hypothetical protein
VTDGEEVTEPERVVEVFRQHYETLGQLPTSATFDEGHSQHAQAVATVGIRMKDSGECQT